MLLKNLKFHFLFLFLEDLREKSFDNQNNVHLKDCVRERVF